MEFFLYQVKYNKKYYLLTKDNSWYEFVNYKELLSFIYNKFIDYSRLNWYLKDSDFINNNKSRIGNNLKDTYVSYNVLNHNSFSILLKVEFIIFDYLFRVVHKDIIIADLKKFNYPKCKKRKPINWLGFRNGPVARTGYGNRASKRCFRIIKTTQEIRRNSWDFKWARKSRCYNNLPNSWDDIHISSIKDRSWKRSTKRVFQWK